MCGKKILAVIVAVPVIAAGAYAVIWHKYADKVERSVASSVEKTDYATVTYDALETTGFPLNIKTVLRGVKIVTDSEKLAKERFTSYYKEKMTDHKNKQVFGDWQDTYTVEGDVVIETAPFSRRATIKTSAPITLKSEIDDDALTVRLNPHDHFAIELAADAHDRESLMWDNYGAVILEKHPYAKKLKEFNATFSGSVAVIGADGKEIPVRECETSRFTAIDKGANASVVEVRNLGCDSFAAGNKLIRKHFALLFPEKIISNFSRVFAEGDSLNADSNAHIELSRESEKVIVADVKELSYKDDVVSYGAKGTVRTHKNDTSVTRIFDGAATLNVTPKYYEESRRKLTKFFASYAANEKDWKALEESDPLGVTMMFDETRGRDPKRFGSVAAQNIFQLYPRLHEFGEIKLDAKVIYKDGQISAEKMEMTSDLYDLKINSKTHKGDGETVYAVSLKNYEDLTKDAVAYAEKLLRAAKRLRLMNADALSLKPGLDAAIVALLQDVAGNAENPLALDLVVGKKEIKVGTLTAPEIMQRTFVNLMPYIERSTPKAPTPQ